MRANSPSWAGTSQMGGGDLSFEEVAEEVGTNFMDHGEVGGKRVGIWPVI